MPTSDLLPGVTTDSCPPVVVCDAHAAIRSARRRAMLRDATQVSLLLAVDYLFMHWPESRISSSRVAMSCGLTTRITVSASATASSFSAMVTP